MSRRGLVTTNRVLAIVMSGMLVTTFLPSRYLGWTTALAKVVQRLTAPPSDLIKVVGDLFAGSEPAAHPDAIIGQIDNLRRQILGLEIENQRLSRENAELRGITQTQSAPLQLIPARIISTSTNASGRLLRARAGTRDGVLPGSVAATRGSHLLGRVINIDNLMCEIIPITDRNAGTIEVTTTTDEQGHAGLRFDITPVGDGSGTLKGPGRYITDGPEQTPRLAQVGQRVSLSDEAWPGHEGLIVGQIIAVEPDENSPQRQVITVEPIINTRNVGSVVIRVPGTGS